jgi:hypothetical protein
MKSSTKGRIFLISILLIILLPFSAQSAVSYSFGSNNFHYQKQSPGDSLHWGIFSGMLIKMFPDFYYKKTYYSLLSSLSQSNYYYVFLSNSRFVPSLGIQYKNKKNDFHNLSFTLLPNTKKGPQSEEYTYTKQNSYSAQYLFELALNRKPAISKTRVIPYVGFDLEFLHNNYSINYNGFGSGSSYHRTANNHSNSIFLSLNPSLKVLKGRSIISLNIAVNICAYYWYYGAFGGDYCYFVSENKFINMDDFGRSSLLINYLDICYSYMFH